MRARRSEIVDYGRLPDAVRIVVDAEAEEYWPQVEAELAQILLGDEYTVTDSFWRTLKEIESLPVCMRELQEGSLRITDDGVTARPCRAQRMRAFGAGSCPGDCGGRQPVRVPGQIQIVRRAGRDKP